MRNILKGRYSPPLFFMDADDGGGAGGGDGTLGLVAPAGGSGGDQERVEGETAPNFGALGKPKDEVVEPTPKEPAEPPEGGKAPEKSEKPAGEAAKPGAEPKKEEPKAKEAPKAEPKKAETTPKEPAKPAEPVKKELPKDDKDLEGIQARPGAPTAIIKSLDDMKGIVKETRATARALQTELETTKAELETIKASSGKLTPELQAEIDAAKKINLMFAAQNDPAFQKEFDGNIQKAEEGIIDFLTKSGMAPKVIEEIKAAGIDGWTRWNELAKAFDEDGDILGKQALVDALKARKEAIAAKSGKLAELDTDRDKFVQGMNEKQQKEQAEWANVIQSESAKLAAPHDWIITQQIPADATPEQKALIEAHNAAAEKDAKAFQANVVDAWYRRPERTAEIAFKAVLADRLQAQLTEANTELEAKGARIAELEARLAKIKSAGRIAHVDTPVDTAPIKDNDGKVGGDGSSAIAAFFDKK